MKSKDNLVFKLVNAEENAPKGIPRIFAEGDEILWPSAILPIEEPKAAKKCDANYWLLGPMQIYQ